MRQLLHIVVLLFVFMGCGQDKPPLPKIIEKDYTLIGYNVTKDGVTVMSFPFEVTSIHVNGLPITKRYYGRKNSKGEHSLTIIYTSSNIILDKDKCPVLDTHSFVKECLYVIAHNTSLD